MCGARESVEFRYSRPEHQGGCCQTSVEPSKTLNPVGYQPRETLHTEGVHFVVLTVRFQGGKETPPGPAPPAGRMPWELPLRRDRLVLSLELLY